MGATASNSPTDCTSTCSSVKVDVTAAAKATATATKMPEVRADDVAWIVSSLKPVLPYLRIESVLCLHNVSKLLAWHVHNLGTWRLLCLRDFPSARSLFHDRILLRRATTASPMCGGRERLSGRGYFFFLEGRLEIRANGVPLFFY